MSIVADIVVAIHVAYMAFVVFGFIAVPLGVALRWSWVRNPWFRWLHVLAILFVVAETVFQVSCPLTIIENDLRTTAGEPVEEGSFVGRLLNRLLFGVVPESVLPALYFSLGALAVAMMVFAPPRRFGRAGRVQHAGIR